MKIIQTFWTAGQNPLKHGFGWAHPEYNLMSWALSCLSLREHYDEVELYTDSAGYHILIEVLQLPYTKVHVIFDDFKCLPHHWALSKIKTYSLQTEPFIHIDGDIFLPKPLPKEIHSASLIVQNKEIGTQYYQEMLDRVLIYKDIIFPDFIIRKIKDGLIPSYNMGFFGGTDMSFIKQFTKASLNFIYYNDLNNPRLKKSWTECNILFEQIMFAAMAENDNRDVFCLNVPTKDNGYSFEKYCNLLKYEKQSFFHILGGHKSNKLTNEALSRILLKKHPAFWLKILSFFPNIHSRLSVPTEQNNSLLNTEKCIAQFEDYLLQLQQRWQNLPFDNLFFIENRIVHYNDYLYIEKNIKFYLHPYLQLYTIPDNWNKAAVNILKNRYGKFRNYGKPTIAIVPTITKNGIKDVAIGDLALNIIELLEKEALDFCTLCSRLYACFTFRNKEKIQNIIKKEINYLLYFGIIINNNKII